MQLLNLFSPFSCTNKSLRKHTKGKLIASMFILPFIENSFKHGVSRQVSHSFLEVELFLEANTMQLMVANTKGEPAGKDLPSFKEGIGLQNVKKRLALLYPDKHELVIEEKEKTTSSS